VVRRRCFTIASALSLFLCVATAVLWARSYKRCDELGFVLINHKHRDKAIFLDSGLGQLGARIEMGELDDEYVPGLSYSSRPPNPRLPATTAFWARHNFSATKLKFDWMTWRRVGLPHWVVAGVMAILPTVSLRRYLKTRSQSGHCPHCRYDLTGNASGICPECGSAIKAS